MAKRYKKDYREHQSTVLETEGRIPPQAVEIEEAVLGGMLIDRDAALMGMESLKITDFL